VSGVRAPGRLIVLGTSRHMDDFATNQELTEQIHVLFSNYIRVGLTNRR
jgi:hypothetical protein